MSSERSANGVITDKRLVMIAAVGTIGGCFREETACSNSSKSGSADRGVFRGCFSGTPGDGGGVAFFGGFSPVGEHRHDLGSVFRMVDIGIDMQCKALLGFSL